MVGQTPRTNRSAASVYPFYQDTAFFQKMYFGCGYNFHKKRGTKIKEMIGKESWKFTWLFWFEDTLIFYYYYYCGVWIHDCYSVLFPFQMHDSLTFLARTIQARIGSQLPVFGTFGITPPPCTPMIFHTTATSLRRRISRNLTPLEGLGLHLPPHLPFLPLNPPRLWRWPRPLGSIFAPTASSRWNSPLPRRSTIRPAMVIRHQHKIESLLGWAVFLIKRKLFAVGTKEYTNPMNWKHWS